MDQGLNLSYFGFRLLSSLNSSALDHSAAVPPIKWHCLVGTKDEAHVQVPIRGWRIQDESLHQHLDFAAAQVDLSRQLLDF